MIIHSRRDSLGDYLCGAISWAIGLFLLGVGIGFLFALIRGVAYVLTGS